MIYNIIQSVTEKLSSLPYIEGIVLRQPLLRSCSKRPRRFLGSGISRKFQFVELE